MSMFYARQAEKRRHFIFIHIYKHLRQDMSHRSLWTWIWELLHATEALPFCHFTCNTSMPDGELAIEVDKADWKKLLPSQTLCIDKIS
jgi:hypothetical protein